MWFLGPKAENADLEEKMILHILRDYHYWRRNYYPSDDMLITEHMRREHATWQDTLVQQINEMLARLKRHFPFYSPRYIAHMLSDQTLPAVLGYFAGMLYNPNNVTPEAAPVTVEWEMEVASSILRMLGYAPIPAEMRPLASLPPLDRPVASGSSANAFGWAHITGGGTVANLEALWVARNVRGFSLAIRQVAQKKELELTVSRPGQSQPVQIASLTDLECLTLAPDEAIALFDRYVNALRLSLDVTPEVAACRAWELISDSPDAIAQQGLFARPGMQSPAIYVSGALHYSLEKIADVLGIGKRNVVMVETDARFRIDIDDLEQKIRNGLSSGKFPLAVIAIAGTTEEGAVDPVHAIDRLRSKLETELGVSFWLHIDAAWGGYIRSLFVPEAEKPGQIDDDKTIAKFVSREIRIHDGQYACKRTVAWKEQEVYDAFLAFPRAESITVDPHKMGYIPYPCGVVAFRDDHARLYIAQNAPYITAMGDARQEMSEPPTAIGPFILEGSKPGASAASCWLSHRLIPPHRAGYGQIMRASLLAARELYELLILWEERCRANRVDTAYRFYPISPEPPDTNIVCFIVKGKATSSLKRTNHLNARIYESFTIQTELGERDYSYGQPFFLSRTRFYAPRYSGHAISDLCRRADLRAEEYENEGIFVLRATVMTPYITLAAESENRTRYLDEFFLRLGEISENAVSETARST